MTLDAVYPIARNRPSFPELLEEGLSHTACARSTSERLDTNFDVDITEVLETKFEALSKHATQIGEMEELRAADAFWRGEDGRYVERFRRIALPF